MKIKSILFIIAGVFFSLQTAFVYSQEKYVIYDTKKQQPTSIEMIVDAIAPGEILVFGELHGDSVAHNLQMQLAAALFERVGDKLVITMEMFETDIQHVLDEYLKGLIAEKNFIKESRAWNNYKDYKPIVEFAKKESLAVIAANSPARYTNMVSRGGLNALLQLPKKVRKQWLPPMPIDTLTGEYFDLFLKAMGGHVMPNMHIYQSQNLWDASMSYNIYKAAKNNQNGVVYHLTGKFHSDYYLGTVFRLQHNYRQQVKTISFNTERDINAIDWDKYSKIADYVIVREKIMDAEVKK